jgi:hypothetical protein
LKPLDSDATSRVKPDSLPAGTLLISLMEGLKRIVLSIDAGGLTKAPAEAQDQKASGAQLNSTNAKEYSVALDGR